MNLSFKILRLFLFVLFVVSVFLVWTTPVMSARKQETPIINDEGDVIGHTFILMDTSVMFYTSIVFCLLSGISLVVLQHLGKRLSVLEREVERLKDASCP
jgi:hypothetical protein